MCYVRCSFFSIVLSYWWWNMSEISLVSHTCWHGYLSGARCRFAYGPADATATIVSCSSKSILVLPFWYWLTPVVPEKIQ